MNLYGDYSKLSKMDLLRQETGASLAQCKRALELADWDIFKAKEIINKGECQLILENSNYAINGHITITKIPKKLLFISQPFSGIPEEVIFAEREKIKEAVERFTEETYTVIDQFHQAPPKDGNRLHYLSNDIRWLGAADLIAFAPNWKSAKGCRIEHMVAELYNLPMIEVRAFNRRT